MERFSKIVIGLFFVVLISRCGISPQTQSSVSETHPYLPHLSCERAQGSTLVGVMYMHQGTNRREIARFGGLLHVGGCELARRAAREDRVCVDVGGGSFKVKTIPQLTVVDSFGSDFQACIRSTESANYAPTRPGFVAFMDTDELSQTLSHLPHVSNPTIESALRDPNTIWYDENSMIFSYQDSFGRPVGPEGLRANRVGYDVGITNSVPDIRLLTSYFELNRFRFPFSVAAGNHGDENVYPINFWLPPRVDGQVLPVLYWLNSTHWHWTFPIGTIFGEVLMMRDPATQEYYAFEVRSRIRGEDSWITDVQRPFVRATDMASAIKADRPNWSQTDLVDVVNALENSNNLVAASKDTTSYRKIVPTFNGYEDRLPESTDYALWRSYLSNRRYSSSMGISWKSNGSSVSYAPTTDSAFHIVPKNYIGGLLQTSESACRTCHEHTGRPLYQLEPRVLAYGEVWGEEEIFTWHPFEVGTKMFYVSDGSRAPNAKMVQAGLIRSQNPNQVFEGKEHYNVIARSYPTDYR